MRQKTSPVEALLDEAMLSVDELCRATAVDAQWLSERVQAGLLLPAGSGAETRNDWRFDAPALHRVRCMVRIERSFDAPPELGALVADLEAEIARLRALLRRGGLG